MRSAVKRRVIWAVVIGLVLMAIVVGILAFVDVTAMTEDAKRCAPTILQSQWPKYVGCTMAAHEGLAGGLIGAAGALFAAWLAFDAIQEQMAAEKELREREQVKEDERRRLQQAEAKEVGVMCITPAVHAAAAALAEIRRALLVQGNDTKHPGDLVGTAVKYVQSALDTFTVRESVRDLGLDDRLVYLAIVGTLATFVNTSTQPSPALTRTQRLQNQQHALMNIHTYLKAFDAELAGVYARDSQTTAPA